MTDNNIKPVRIRLELMDNNLSDRDKVILKRYGESTTGTSIIRDVIIPSDMPLHNLHYVIQKAFGFQNSHLRRFVLPESIHNTVTGGTVQGWADLVGTLYQSPTEGQEDIFWDNDYKPNSSFNSWLKRKYKGPYVYKGNFGDNEASKNDIKTIVDNPNEFEIRESFEDYMARSKENENTEIQIIGKARLRDMTLNELHQSIIIENGTDNLSEQLLVNDVIAFDDENLNDGNLFPVTKELIYNYDFGDDWKVFITKHKDYNDLLENYLTTPEEISELEDLVLKKYKPYCIHRDGLPVIDDVGGLRGYAHFLAMKYEKSEGVEEASEIGAWATSMGWRPTKTIPREII